MTAVCVRKEKVIAITFSVHNGSLVRQHNLCHRDCAAFVLCLQHTIQSLAQPLEVLPLQGCAQSVCQSKTGLFEPTGGSLAGATAADMWADTKKVVDGNLGK